MTNVENLYLHGYIFDAGLSDRSMVIVNRKKASTSRSIFYIKCRNYRGLEPKLFQDDIDEIVWDDIYNCCNVSVCTQMFQDRLLKLLDIHAPWWMLKLRNNAPPWINME